MATPDATAPAITTTIGRVRLLVGSYVPSTSPFTDTMITDAHSWKGSEEGAAAVLLRGVLANRAMYARSWSDELGRSVDETALAPLLRDAIKDLESLAGGSVYPTAGVFFENLPMDQGYTET